MIKICLAMLIFMGASAFADAADSVDPTTAQTIATYGSWTLECAHYKVDTQKKICRLSQLFSGSDQIKWATAQVIARNGAYALILNTFVYPDSEKNVLIQLDGKEAGQALFQCSTSVCGYIYRVDGDDLAKYLAAQELELSIPPEDSPAVFKLDLKQFKAALDALSAEQAKP